MAGSWSLVGGTSCICRGFFGSPESGLSRLLWTHKNVPETEFGFLLLALTAGLIAPELLPSIPSGKPGVGERKCKTENILSVLLLWGSFAWMKKNKTSSKRVYRLKICKAIFTYLQLQWWWKEIAELFCLTSRVHSFTIGKIKVLLKVAAKYLSDMTRRELNTLPCSVKNKIWLVVAPKSHRITTFI